MPYVQRYNVTKLCNGAQMTNFCILYFQQVACSTFQTCILNWHLGHIMCGRTVDIQKRRRNHSGKIECMHLLCRVAINTAEQILEVYRNQFLQGELINNDGFHQLASKEKDQHY